MQKEGEEEKRIPGKGEGGEKPKREIMDGYRYTLGLPSTTFTSADGYKY